jgi:hypothetical protein
MESSFRKLTDITGMFTFNLGEAVDLPFNPALGTGQWIFDYMDWLGQQSITLINGSVVTIKVIGWFLNLKTLIRLYKFQFSLNNNELNHHGIFC